MDVQPEGYFSSLIAFTSICAVMFVFVGVLLE